MTENQKPFSFSPAPLRAGQSYTLVDNALRREDDEGWVLPLIQVTRAGFVQHKARGALMWRLDLWQGDTLRRLSYTGAVTTWQEDPQARVFFALCSAVANGLEATQPGFQITRGEYGGARLAMFLVGLAALLAGPGIFAMALATGVTGSKLITGALPMLLLTGMGLAMTFAYAPWKKPPSLPAVQLAAVLQIKTAPGGPAGD